MKLLRGYAPPSPPPISSLFWKNYKISSEENWGPYILAFFQVHFRSDLMWKNTFVSSFYFVSRASLKMAKGRKTGVHESLH